MYRLYFAVLLCATSAATVAAGSAVPPWAIAEYELINDGPKGLTPICMVWIWDVLREPSTWTNPLDPSTVLELPANTAVGTCMLQFTNKISTDYRIVLPEPHRQNFHALAAESGNELEVIHVYDYGHKSSDRMWLAMFIAPHPKDPRESLRKRDTTSLVSNAGSGGVYIDARRPGQTARDSAIDQGSRRTR
jgi:hypothetical protein